MLENNTTRFVGGILISFILLGIVAGYVFNLRWGPLEWGNYILILITICYVVITGGLLEEAQKSRRIQHKPSLVYRPYIGTLTGKVVLSAENAGLGPASDVHFRIRILHGKEVVNRVEAWSDVIYTQHKAEHVLPYNLKKLEELSATDIEVLIDYYDIAGNGYGEHGFFNVDYLRDKMNTQRGELKK